MVSNRGAPHKASALERTTQLCSSGLRFALMFGSALEMAGSAHAEPAAIVRSARSSPGLPFAAFIAEAAQRFNIPMNWIRAVIGVESSLRVPALLQGRDGPHAAHAQDVL